ncbi:MAG: outer membrane lipoprotein carrier protein LolA [Candidatus Aureabacteria bacterium]|nr:outer membrane lipoprotein carrier protein LolA [Candidatus Auribacterota bacterium]
MNTHRLFAIPFFLALVMRTAVIADAGEGVSTEAILKKMESAGKTLSCLKADFTQVRTYALFDEKKESSGTILYKKPGMMVWKYNAPDNSAIYIKGKSALMYLPDINQVQKVSLAQDRKTESLLIGFGNTAEEITRNFTARSSTEPGGCHLLELTPKSEELKSQFQKLRLSIDPKRWVPVRSERFEQGGDRTVFTFSRVMTDVVLKDDLFEFTAPKGAEIVEY